MSADNATPGMCRCGHPRGLHDANEGRCIGWANDRCGCWAFGASSISNLPVPVDPMEHDDSQFQFGYVCRRSEGCTPDVRQHRADPDCWCQPTAHPGGTYDHHDQEPT